jgi:periplasmic protein TonB
MNLRVRAGMLAVVLLSAPVTGQVSTPSKVKDVKPAYPPESLKMGDEGVVVIELSIAASGQVSNAQILWSGCERLNKSALTAARQWRYEQVRVNGKPTPFKVTVKIPFRLSIPPQAQAARVGACRWREPPGPNQ